MTIGAAGLLTCSGPSSPDLSDPSFDNPYDEQGDNYIPKPDIDTAPVTGIRALQAESGGQFETNYGKPVTAKGVCWSTEENPTLEDDCTNDGQGLDAFTSVIVGLEPDRVYYVRAYATNESGTIYGGQRIFTTRDGIPVLTTISPFEIRSTSVLTGGEITDDGGADITDRGVCYIDGSVEPDFSDNCLESGTEAGNFEVLLEDLLPNREYAVRAYATTKVGTGWGQANIFITIGNLPVISTAEPGSVRAFSAVVGGEISDQGDAPVDERGVCLSTDPEPDLEDRCETSGSGTGLFEVIFENLEPETRYHIRAYAISSAGTGWGQDQQFTTLDGIPVLTTTEPFDITAFTAQTGGDITDDGGAEITGRGVCYVEGSGEPDLSDHCVESGTGTGGFDVLLEDLVPDSPYTIRAYATNIKRTSYGAIKSFRTSQEDSDDWPRDNQTAVVEVTNPATGRVWMDRNLGASRAASSSADELAYGDLYQWGRGADGHQLRNSETTSTLSSSDQPGHGNFILAPDWPFDWRSTQNDNYWQGANGVNNPCPIGYRLPTVAEWDVERSSWSSDNAVGAYASPLKLPRTGRRSSEIGSLHNVGFSGYYWSSSLWVSSAHYLNFFSEATNLLYANRAKGYSVRCIKD